MNLRRDRSGAVVEVAVHENKFMYLHSVESQAAVSTRADSQVGV
jgi:hypothetical protein